MGIFVLKNALRFRVQRDALGVMNGHIQRQLPDEESDEVVVSVGEDPELLPTGAILDRSTSYCRRVVDENSLVALSNVPKQEWADDPAYVEHGFDCYLGTTIEESTVGITIGDATHPDIPISYANEGFERLTGYRKNRVMGRNCRFLQGDATDEKRRDRLIEVMDCVIRHNLRTDMNIAEGFAEMIREQTDREVARMVGRIESTAGGLTNLSEKAQAFEAAARDSKDLDEQDIVTEIQAVVTELRKAHPDAEFGIDAPSSGSVLATDRLQSALQEIGENAAEHGDSPIIYRIEMDDDGRLVVRVHDTGPGLPQLERTVLEVGRETPLEHGIGLGLWLVNWIITGLGGEVTASVDNGTTITVRLPPITDGVSTDGPDSHRHAAISTRE